MAKMKLTDSQQKVFDQLKNGCVILRDGAVIQLVDPVKKTSKQIGENVLSLFIKAGKLEYRDGVYVGVNLDSKK